MDVSIVIPCFNHGRYLREAVESALAYDGPRTIEVIVVDDGSDDRHTAETLDRLSDEGIRVLREPHRGAAAARNAGIEAAAGRYILSLDADNRLRPRYVDVGAGILDSEPEVGVVYGDSELFGRRSGRRRPGPPDLAKLARGNYIDTCAVFRREVWEQAGGYQGDALGRWEDWDFWLSAAEAGYGFRYVPEVLFEYRVHDGQLLLSARAWKHLRDTIAVKHTAFFAEHGRGLRYRVAAWNPAFYSALVRGRRALRG